jgi:hypothetical protein
VTIGPQDSICGPIVTVLLAQYVMFTLTIIPTLTLEVPVTATEGVGTTRQETKEGSTAMEAKTEGEEEEEKDIDNASFPSGSKLTTAIVANINRMLNLSPTDHLDRMQYEIIHEMCSKVMNDDPRDALRMIIIGAPGDEQVIYTLFLSFMYTYVLTHFLSLSFPYNNSFFTVNFRCRQNFYYHGSTTNNKGIIAATTTSFF